MRRGWDTKIALLDRISVLEEKIASGNFVSAAKKAAPLPKEEFSPVSTPEDLPWEEDEPGEGATDSSPAQDAAPEDKLPEEKADEKKSEAAAPKKAAESNGEVASRWPEIVSYLKKADSIHIYSHLLLVSAKESDGKLCIIFDDNTAMSKGIVGKPSNIALVRSAVLAVTGKDMEVVCTTAKEIGDDDPFKKLEELSKTHSGIEFI